MKRGWTIVISSSSSKPYHHKLTAPNLAPSISSAPISAPHNCLSCGVTRCFRSQVPDRSIQARTGYLVDDWWLEFVGVASPLENRYIQTVRTKRDRLYLPTDDRYKSNDCGE